MVTDYPLKSSILLEQITMTISMFSNTSKKYLSVKHEQCK